MKTLIEYKRRGFILMKKYRAFLFAFLPTLALSLLTGCVSAKEEEKVYEVGDTVIEWTNKKDSSLPVLNLNKDEKGTAKVVQGLGNYDKWSIEYNVDSNYVSSEVLEEPYFTEDHAKNGDIISLYFYLPSDHNIASIQLEALGIGNFVTTFYGGSEAADILGEKVSINSEEKEGQWVYTELIYNTLETLGAIRFNFERKDASKNAHFYLDDISIIYGEETVKTGYKYNDESLYQVYEDYFKVGSCMSATMLQNTKLREILKNDFNSVTAENEGKPEQVLDQEGCQALAKTDQTAVAITTKPFEKLYDFAEANHIGVRHHTFVWYSQTPEWFFNQNYESNGTRVSKQVMLGRMENFIRVSLETINDRWPGLVYAIDVANEAIENGGTRTNNNNWYNVVGEDFVYYAFKYASQYKDDGQEIYYNDFSYDYNYAHCEYAINTLLKRAISEGIIDGVGIQGHIDDDQNMDTVINDAKLIYSKGLKCQITELDLETRGSGDDKWQKQKDAYSLLIRRVLESNEKGETDINAVIVWGITDNLSWKRGNNPLLFDSEYTKKPCYYGFLNALDEYQSKTIEE